MGKQRGHGGQRQSGLPTMDWEYWDVRPEDGWDEPDGPTVGARMTCARDVTVWARNLPQIAEFVKWLLDRIETAEEDRKLAGSLQGRFDFQRMGLECATIDDMFCVRVPGQFIGLMLEAPKPESLGPFMLALINVTLAKAKRAARLNLN